jgi:hypothetical protein
MMDGGGLWGASGWCALCYRNRVVGEEAGWLLCSRAATGRKRYSVSTIGGNVISGGI